MQRWLSSGYDWLPVEDDGQEKVAAASTHAARGTRVTVYMACACALSLGALLVLNSYANEEETAFIAQHTPNPSTKHMGGTAEPHARLCSGSLRDAQGSWENVSTAQHMRRRHPIYDQVPWNTCRTPALFASFEERYIRGTGCQTLDLLDGVSALGGRNLHLVGDSLTRYSWGSLRWARRRTILEFLLCGNRASGQPIHSDVGEGSGLREQVWAALAGSQGMEGDFRVHIAWVNRMRAWLGWEGDRNAREVRNGVSYTPFPHSWCSEHWPAEGTEEIEYTQLFKLFYRANATEPSDELLMLNMGAWYNLERTSKATQIGNMTEKFSWNVTEKFSSNYPFPIRVTCHKLQFMRFVICIDGRGGREACGRRTH